MRTFLWLWLFFGARLLGQDYALIKADGVYLYENGTYVVPVRIDSSITMGTNTFLYNVPTIRGESFTCTNMQAPHWLGKYIMVEPNGDYVFFNWENDSIRIKTKANINDTWTCMHLANGLQVVAYVANWDTLSFLGVVDSVKYIEFQAVDALGASINHPLNAYSLQISKNYGAVYIPGFFRFEETTPPQFIFDFSEFEIPSMYSLIGTPNLGKKNLTLADIHTFEVGDEVHLSYYGTNPSSCCSGAQIMKVIDVNPSPDTSTLGYEIWYRYRNPVSSDTNHVIFNSPYWGVFQPWYYEDERMEALPFETVMSYDLSNNYGGTIFNTYFDSLGRMIKRSFVAGTGLFGDSTNLNCWEVGFPHQTMQGRTYIEGVGILYYEGYYSQGSGGDYTHEVSLVYYKKGSQEWGTPMTVSQVMENEEIAKAKITLYPNPATDWAYIHFEDARYAGRELRIQVRDMQGKEVISPATLQSGATYMLRTSDLAAGIYSVEVREGEEVLWAEKLVLD